MLQLQFPIPFLRLFRYWALPKRLHKYYDVTVIERGKVTFLILNGSVEELREIEAIQLSHISRCFKQVATWCKPERKMLQHRVCCLGRSAPTDHLPTGMGSLLAPEVASGCWDGRTQTVFVRLDSQFPVFQNVAHELTHSWNGLATGHWPFPEVIEEGFARAIERMFGFDPSGCHLSGWEDPARNLQHVRNIYPFLTIRDLLIYPSPGKRGKLDERLSWMWNWETDALLAYLRDRIIAPNGLDGIFNRMDGQWIGARARLRWIAASCGQSTDELEKDFREYARSGSWSPLTPLMCNSDHSSGAEGPKPLESMSKPYWQNPE